MTSDLDNLLAQVADQSGLAWNDETYDLALARTLSGDERAAYVATLIDNAQQGDARAILTLGHLQATEVLPLLRADGHSARPWALVARRALTILGHGDEVVDEIALDAAHGNGKMARLAAVNDLVTIGGPVALASLDQAMADPEYVVRVTAWDGLISRLDLERFLLGPDGKRQKTTHLELMRDFLLSELNAFVTMGVEETRAITRKVATGSDPATLDLAWIPDPDPDLSNRIVAAIVDPETPFPIDAIARLSGVPRRWAEAAIALRLEQNPIDVRIPEALAHLFATWTVPALEEVAKNPKTSSETRAPIDLALGMLARHRGEDAGKIVAMADFSWPVFDGEPLDGNRTWSATFDSYDQYHDDCYYAVRLFEGATALSAFTVKFGMGFAPDYDDWTVPGFEPALRIELSKYAARGETNTEHIAYALR